MGSLNDGHRGVVGESGVAAAERTRRSAPDPSSMTSFDRAAEKAGI